MVFGGGMWHGERERTSLRNTFFFLKRTRGLSAVVKRDRFHAPDQSTNPVKRGKINARLTVKPSG